MNENLIKTNIKLLANFFIISKDLCCSRKMFGGIKINDYQLGFAWGMCDRFTQISGINNEEESLSFIMSVFGLSFGEKDADTLVARALKKQKKFHRYILEGGKSVDLWISKGKDKKMMLLLPLANMRPGKHYAEMAKSW